VLVKSQDIKGLPLWEKGEEVTTPGGEDEEFEREWGEHLYDARTHSLFTSFKQHVAGHACWAILSQMDREYASYYDACIGTYALLQHMLQPVSDRLTEQGLQSMADRIFLSTLYKPLSYRCVTEDEIEAYRIILPNGNIRYPQLEENLKSQCAIAYVELDLGEVENQVEAIMAYELPLHAIVDVAKILQELVEQFQKVLSPDVSLRELIFSGHCDSCP